MEQGLSVSASHTVQQGEHLSAIAAQYGFGDYAVVWNHPDNASLKDVRGDPNVLLPGDTVAIPDKNTKQETGATAQRHRFTLAQTPLKLRLLLEEAYSNPVTGASCILTANGTKTDTTTNDEGKVEQRISSGLTEATLTVDVDGSLYADTALMMSVGALDPVDVLSGQAGRLTNLGYLPGTPEAADDPAFQSALQEFQCDYRLLVDGDPGPKTQAKLREVHGC